MTALTVILSIAYGGTLGTSLFKNSMTASPYLAFQYGYSIAFPPSYNAKQF